MNPPETITGLFTVYALLTGNWPIFQNAVWHLILPALTLGYFSTAMLLRITRSSMLEALSQDYVRTARSKGLREQVVVLRHVFKNSMPPILTTTGLTFGSLLSGAVVTAAGSFGTLVGLFAGYRRGWIDEVAMRVTDIFFAFPPLILAMAIAGALGPSLRNALIAVVVVLWPVYARLVRGQVLSLRESEFIQAAQVTGVSNWKIITRHLLPNTMAPLLAQASFDMGTTILTVAGLSFIGFGAQPPTPEWGVMISDGRNYITTQWWLTAVPAGGIFLLVAAFNLVGDGLRDILDPRLRR